MTVGIAASALLLTIGSLIALDAWRFKGNAQVDVASIASLLAENMSAALSFDRRDEARALLEPVRLRPQIQRACVYDKTGKLFQDYHRPPAAECPSTLPSGQSWWMFEAAASVKSTPSTLPHDADDIVGTVYVQRDWSTLVERITWGVMSSLVVLVLATLLSIVLAHRLQKAILTPIVQLSAAAQTIGRDEQYDTPLVESTADEVGNLIAAFGSMVDRIRNTNRDLRETNQALRHEIAERRRMEADREVLLARERDANRLKDEFLAVVSHELRTPLNAILGWARILSVAPPDPPTLARATASLARNAKAQARVIDDLIDISRIVTGKLRVRFETVDLRAAVEAAAESIRPSTEHKGVSMTIELPADPAPLQADRDRLQQVIWNLMSNAVKFTPSGGTVAVSLLVSPDAYEVVVTDSGMGIAPEFLPHVFDRFRQADASMTREFSGLGIGLAIVKELTELHGGTVTASSNGVGQGARFAIRLPRALHTTPLERPVHPDDVVTPSLAGVRVLAVDDNRDALEVLDAVLGDAGAHVRLANSGAEALAEWERETPDIVLCDLAMPEMNGYELLAEIRERDATVRRFIPAIAVTAQASEEHVAQSMRAGFQQHIAKPFDGADLVRAVAQALHRA
jgi:signal transduction histidine kinase/ActR/RegA family two-component response regulator